MCFICVDDVEWEELDWGDLGWVVRPANVPEGEKLCVLDVKIQPGQGHDFHRHPNQEEVILLRSGAVEQWIREERKELRPGDVAFIPDGHRARHVRGVRRDRTSSTVGRTGPESRHRRLRSR